MKPLLLGAWTGLTISFAAEPSIASAEAVDMRRDVAAFSTGTSGGREVDTVEGNVVLPQPEPRFEGFSWWINAGIGIGSLTTDRRIVGESFAASASLQRRDHLFSVRGAVAFQLLSDEVWDLGLLYGKGTAKPRRHVSVASGLALVGGTRRSGGLLHGVTAEPLPRTLGVPVEAQLFWRPAGKFGLGIYAFANLNRVQSFAGATASIQIGRLR